MLVDTGLPQTVCAPQTIHNVGSPSARGAFSFPSTHTPSGFSPGLVWSRSRPSSKFRGRKPGLCLPLEFCPNFSVFSFFWGGAPHHAKSTLFSTPRPEISVGERSSRARVGSGAFSFFFSFQKSESSRSFQTDEPWSQENRNGGIGNRGPINREHERARFSTNILLDQRHRHSLSASDEALCNL